ncbi:MAG: helix-turn-helix domain-containing protein [Streptosporangiaceae bacterium]|jgi:DNA-binding NarL/FixJ family response regulator
MPKPSPCRIVLSSEEEAVLAARSVRGPYRDRLRATIVLAAAAGQGNAAIARELRVCTGTVRKWRSGSPLTGCPG